MAVIIGNNGDNTLNGTGSGDLIAGRGGDDTIDGGGGNDLIFGGRGNDVIDGGDGHDLIFGGRGSDTIDGGNGNDVLFGGSGNDVIDGNDGHDLLVGGSGNDILNGGAGCDLIYAGCGNDTVIYDVDENGSAHNCFDGGRGNDVLRLRVTQSQLDEIHAAGIPAAFALIAGTHQIFDFSSFGLSFDLNLSVARFETLEFEVTSAPSLFTENDDAVDFNTVVAAAYAAGTQYDALGGNDTVTLADSAAAAATAGFVVGTAFNAGAGDDAVTGGSLDDVINGDAGNDVIDGGTGLDTIHGGTGDDRITVTDLDLADSVDGGADTDTFVYTLADGAGQQITLTAASVILDTVTYAVSNFENFEITGGNGNDVINDATGGNGILRGGDGNDTLSAGTGVDQLFGGAGNDRLDFRDAADLGDSADGGAGTDTFQFREVTTGNNNVISVANDYTSATVDGTAISLIDIELANIFGGGGNDDITGGDGNDILNGQAGNDTIRGGDGNDTLSGTTGVDQLFGDAGNDLLDFWDTADAGDIADGGAGLDTFQFREVATGNNNVISVASDYTSATVDGTAMSLIGIERATILGGGGNDDITGGDQIDNLNGQAGNDTIRGGKGNDTMSGGSGDDRFVFAIGDGIDTIADFTPGAGTDDVADVSAFGFTSFDGIGGTRLIDSATDNGSHTTIDLGQGAPSGDQLVLLNVVVADLDSSDFIL